MSTARKLNNKKVAVELLVPYLLFEYITGKVPSTDTYDNRILWQKVGYLAKQLGFPLNEYNFTWYIRGPYSPAYTSVLFDIKETSDIHQYKHEYTLADHSLNQLEPLKRMVGLNPFDMTLPLWLELLASIHYLSKSIKSKDQVYSRLIKDKPMFSDKVHFDYAWKVLTTENLL
jgi:uncharacterized protein YwgA